MAYVSFAHLLLSVLHFLDRTFARHTVGVEYGTLYGRCQYVVAGCSVGKERKSQTLQFEKRALCKKRSTDATGASFVDYLLEIARA